MTSFLGVNVAELGTRLTLRFRPEDFEHLVKAVVSHGCQERFVFQHQDTHMKFLEVFRVMNLIV